MSPELIILTGRARGVKVRRGEGYSYEFKKSTVQKLLNRGGRTIMDISREVGISSTTLYQWRDEFAKVGGMKKTSQRPQDKTPKEKFKAVIEFENLSEEKRGEFLRREGFHIEHIREWRDQMEKSLLSTKSKKTDRSERIEDQRKIKELEREIKRKDKALAETAALLILKKKANLIWGTGEDE